MTAWDRKALDEGCSRLMLDTTFFQTDNEFTAWQGHVGLRAIGRAMEDGELLGLFKCSAQTYAEECTKLRSKLESATLRTVETCNTFGVARSATVLWSDWVGPSRQGELEGYSDRPG